MNIPHADDLNRTALISARDGTAATVEAALSSHSITAITLITGPAASLSVPGQAALCTAVAAAVRAFGTVRVITSDDAILDGGPYRGSRVTEMIAAEGALLSSEPAANGPILLVGAAEPPPLDGTAGPDRVLLHATWNGWIAGVAPAQLAGDRIDADCSSSDSENVIAAITAAAIGVHEAFGATHPRAGGDLGYRTMVLNLWRPGSEVHDGPVLSHAPAAWWLVGLGHLGQAYAWVISWLNYADPSTISIVLQDTDYVVHANHSTGLFTPPYPALERKTRLIARVLDKAGFNASLIERKLDRHTRITEADHHVALIGVDNIFTRRLISAVGWPLAIDAGLGLGPSDYNAILLRRFPGGQPSHEVSGWAMSQQARPAIPDTPAFRDLTRRDPCGVVTIAGTAVGAAFVGVTAACLAVAEAIRDLLGGTGHSAMNVHLGSNDIISAPVNDIPDLIPASLVS